MKIRRILDLVRRHTAVPVLALAAGAAGGWAVTSVLPPTYRAEASVLVTPATADEDATGPVDLTLAQRLTPTVARLAESREVTVAAAAALGVPQDVVFGHVHSTSEPGLQIVTIRATARTGRQAADISNAVTEALRRKVGEMRMAGQSVVTVQPFDSAWPPSSPVTPKPGLNLALGAFAGLLAGLGLASLRNRLDDRLRDVRQIERAVRLPVLAALPRLPGQATVRPHTVYQRSNVAAAVDAAVATLSVLAAATPRQRILVVGLRDSTRVDLVASLLATGFARQHRQVTLVEGRPTRPVLAGLFPGSERCTLRHLIDDDRLPEVVPDCPGLSVVPADPMQRNFGAGGTDMARIGALLTGLARTCDVVVATTPPVLASPDLTPLARHADAVLLVVEAGRAGRNEARRAALLVRHLGTPLAGVVVVDATADDEWADSAWPDTLSPTLPDARPGSRHRPTGPLHQSGPEIESALLVSEERRRS